MQLQILCSSSVGSDLTIVLLAPGDGSMPRHKSPLQFTRGIPRSPTVNRLANRFHILLDFPAFVIHSPLTGAAGRRSGPPSCLGETIMAGFGRGSKWKRRFIVQPGRKSRTGHRRRQGYGKACALALARAGADVALGLRRKGIREALAREIEGMGRRSSRRVQSGHGPGWREIEGRGAGDERGASGGAIGQSLGGDKTPGRRAGPGRKRWPREDFDRTVASTSRHFFCLPGGRRDHDWPSRRRHDHQVSVPRRDSSPCPRSPLYCTHGPRRPIGAPDKVPGPRVGPVQYQGERGG